MRTAAEGAFVMAKLDDGEDLFASLKGLANRHGVESGTVLWGIGMVRDFEVGYFDGKAYRRRVFDAPHELIALHGSMAMRADPALHLHVATGNEGHGVVGGHLFRATVSTLNEVCVARFASIRLNRTLNPASGLKELALETPSGAGPST